LAEGGPRPLRLTVDASVVSRWFVPGEEYESQALKLRNDYAEGSVDLNAPHLLVFEVANALWKAVRRQLADVQTAVKLYKAFHNLRPEIIDLGLEDFATIMKLAVEHRLTAYDASYIVTALKTRSTLISADNALCDTASKSVRAVHLRDYL